MNLEESDKKLFAHEFERNFKGYSIFKFQNVWIDSGGMVAGKRKRIHKASLANLRISKEDIKRHNLASLKLGLKSIQGKIKKGIWISERWSHGYFHWLCDALSRYAILPEPGNDYQVILPESYSNYKYITDSLDYLGLNYVFVKRGHRFFVDELLMSEPTAPPGNYHPEAIKKVRALIQPQQKSVAERRLYISRNKASVRRWLNEEKCEPIMRKYGFEKIYFEDHTFGDQMKIMNEASVIMGVHGAGLTNILAAPEGMKMIEIRGESDDSNNCFFSLAAALNSPYYYLLAQENPTENDRVGNVEVNPERLDQLLSKIFGTP